MPIVMSESADLREYPEPLLYVDLRQRLVLGDMHGNALKLLYLLIRHGVVSTTKASYLRFKDIYCSYTTEDSTELVQFKALTESELKTCRTIINDLSVNPKRKLCLVGDLLADRGKNDLLTLWIIAKLHISKLDFIIIISNHDLEFIRFMERGEDARFEIHPEQMRSLLALIALKKAGLIETKEIRELYALYIQHLQLLYGRKDNQRTLVIITHAPVGLRIIKKAATCLGIPQEDDYSGLVKTISQINLLIRDFAAKGILCSQFIYAPSPKNPFHVLAWNREFLSDNERPFCVVEGSVEVPVVYIHGHVVHEDLPEQVQSLDDCLGKQLGFEEEGENLTNTYTAAVIHEQKASLMAIFTPPNGGAGAATLPADGEGDKESAGDCVRSKICCIM